MLRAALAGLVVAGIVSLGAPRGWLTTVRVSSVNMMPTLALEDRVVVSRLGGDPQSGDVVVYRSPFGNSLLVARVVGAGGDAVEMDDTGLYVSGCPVTVPEKTAASVGMSPDAGESCSIDAVDATCSGDANCRVPDCPGHGHAGACDGATEGLLVASEAVGRHCYCVRKAGSLSSLMFGRRTVPPGHVFVLNDNRVDERDSRIFGPIPLEAVVGIASFVYYASDESGIRWDRMNRRVS